MITDAVKADFNKRSVFLHEHGMLLREHGLLYLDTRNVYLSMFVNLTIPLFNLAVILADTNVHTIANEVVERHDQLLSIDNSHEKAKSIVLN